MQSKEDWYKIKRRDVLEKGGGGLLIRYIVLHVPYPSAMECL